MLRSPLAMRLASSLHTLVSPFSPSTHARQARSFDTLTQVGDADALRDRLRREQSAAKGAAGASALLMLDIDHFHCINSQHGRSEGDRLLQAVAQVLLLNLRSNDLLCRYAGDRFGILLPATDLASAEALAAHLCQAVASLQLYPERGGAPVRVTLRSVARVIDGDPRQLLREVNRALERRLSEAERAPNC